jgi:hypothetical protein
MNTKTSIPTMEQPRTEYVCTTTRLGELQVFNIGTGDLVWSSNDWSRSPDSVYIIETTHNSIFLKEHHTIADEQYITCVALNTGEPKWSREIIHGFRDSCVTNNAFYYVDTTNQIVALEHNSGKQAWKHKVDTLRNCRPTEYNGFTYIPFLSNTLLVIRTRSGAIKHEIELPESPETHPLILNDAMYIGLDNGIWRIDLPSSSSPPPLGQERQIGKTKIAQVPARMHDRLVYSPNSDTLCYSAKGIEKISGVKLPRQSNSRKDKLNWIYSLNSSPNNPPTTLPSGNGQTILVQDNSSIHAINTDLGKKKWEWGWKKELDENQQKLADLPLILNSTNFVLALLQKTQNRYLVIALDPKTGKKVWSPITQETLSESFTAHSIKGIPPDK